MAKRALNLRRLRDFALSLLRLLFTVALIAGGYYGFKYVDFRSKAEVAAVKNRQESDYYLIVDKPVRMTVVDEDGEKSMEISGDSVKLTTDQKSAVFTGAKATYFENGEWSIRMQAGQIEYDTQSEDFLLTGGLSIETKDNMKVTAPQVEWRRVKEPARAGAGAKVPSFRFAKGVEVESSDGNTLSSDYMQADKELMYMELVGNVSGTVLQMKDTGFIKERNLTDVKELNLEDFDKLAFRAEEVIYDKRNQVVLATSRYYDRKFNIRDMDGRIVDIAQYQPDPEQVTFSKKEITIKANHLEAHIDNKWVECLGDIDMVIPPAEAKEGDDKALKVVKKSETRVATEDVEYFWGHDYILTHGPTRVEQADRLAMADQIVYWGDQKEVLLDGNITMVQGDGRWLVDDDLVSVDNHDIERAVTSYSELYADRAVVYLNNNDFIASGDVMVRQDEREVAADTIVYQDEIKRITADGNVKFWDKDNQQFDCTSLIFHSNSDFMQVQGGALATMRLPAKFANDINRTLAEVREEPKPPEITDPPVDQDVHERNPNLGSSIASGVKPVAPTGPPPISPPFVGPLPIPGQPDTTGGGTDAADASNPQELILNLGTDVGPPAPPPAGDDTQGTANEGGDTP